MKKSELLQNSQIRKKCNLSSNTQVKTWIYRKKGFQENKVTNVLKDNATSSEGKVNHVLI